MKNAGFAVTCIGVMTLLTTAVRAAETPAVPEIDGGLATIAIGLTLGIVALIREYRRRK